jgi:hypothetical protein
MLYLVIFLLFASAVLVFTLLIKVNVVIEYNKIGNYDNVVMSIIILGGLITFKAEFPEYEFDIKVFKLEKVIEKGKKQKDSSKNKQQFSLEDIYEKITKIRELYNNHTNIMRNIKCYLSKKLLLKEFNLGISIGLGDAFYTGITTGALWSLTGTIATYLFGGFKAIKRHINIKPNFNEKELIVDLYCIFRAKLVHIIIVSLRIWMYSKNNQKFNTVIGGDLSG